MKNLLNITKNKVLIVAEIGNNHEGNFNNAKKLILKAKQCGVDAVKFQTCNPNLFYSKSEKKNIKKLEKFNLNFNQLKKLSSIAKKNKLIFFSTPLDLESATTLNKLQNIFKIASSDNNYLDLIKHVASFGKDMIVSTGLSDMNLLKKVNQEILKVWKKNKISANLAFTHCVSSYPTKFSDANIFAVSTLKKFFKNIIIGYSDHTKDITSCLIAVSLGARIVEKHFTLDKNFSNFRDHKLSCDPREMTVMVNRIRLLETMQQFSSKKPQKSELKSAKFSRRSCAANIDLKKGKILKDTHIIGLRPLVGISILNKKKIVNRTLKRNIAVGEIIKYRDIK